MITRLVLTATLLLALPSTASNFLVPGGAGPALLAAPAAGAHGESISASDYFPVKPNVFCKRTYSYTYGAAASFSSEIVGTMTETDESVQQRAAGRDREHRRELGHPRSQVGHFDLRGNAGGVIDGMPDLFLKERTLLYLRRSRGGVRKVFFDPADIEVGLDREMLLKGIDSQLEAAIRYPEEGMQP